jgi:SAP domain
MSRVIDPDQPLSDENREWLVNNGRENEARLHDARLGVEAEYPPAGVMTGAEPSLSTGVPGGRGLVNTPGLSPAQVAVAMGDRNALLMSFTDEELQGELDRREQVAEDEADASRPEQSRATNEVVREGEADVPDYDDWKVDNLRAQLGVRELSKSGNKSELVERLRDDDADNV